MSREAQRRGGLGRGLAALIPTTPTEESGPGASAAGASGINAPKLGSAAADVLIGGGPTATTPRPTVVPDLDAGCSRV